VTYDLDHNHLLYKYQFITNKINIIKEKEKKRNVCLSHDHHPLNICISTSKSIDRLLLLLLKQAPSKCQSDLYCEHTLCKEHDDVDNDEKIPNRTKKEEEGYNVDFSDLHIINIYNEENKY
jgi:hypothetical protein